VLDKSQKVTSFSLKMVVVGGQGTLEFAVEKFHDKCSLIQSKMYVVFADYGSKVVMGSSPKKMEK